jgi:hypothetical protein
MSYLLTMPDELVAAATNLAGIGSSLSAANVSAAPPTSAIVAAAGDEVSAAIASLFSGHAQAYQGLSARAARQRRCGRGYLQRRPGRTRWEGWGRRADRHRR